MIGLLRALAIDGPAREAVAVASWPAVVGETIAGATRVVGLKDGVLEVRTRSHAWNQELTFHKQRILKALNACADGKIVFDIRTHVGPLRPVAGPDPAELPEPDPAEVESLEPTPAAQARIEAAAAHADPDLARLIRRALTREWQLDEWRRRHGYLPCPRCGALTPPPRARCPACEAELRTR